MSRISKHLTLACEAGAVYRLLNQGVSKQELQIQKELLGAAFGDSDSGGSPEPGSTARILRSVHAWKHKLSAVNASTAMHLLAQSDPSTVPLRSLHRDSLELILSTVGGNAQPRDLAIASWAAAKLNLASADSAESALLALNNAIAASAPRLDGQDMANVGWAFATMQLQVSSELLTALGQEASTKLHQFEPKHMVVFTWALAKTKVHLDDFCWAAANEARQSRANKWMPQDISNFLWAFAVLRCEAPAPLEVLAARAAALHWSKFRPQETSQHMIRQEGFLFCLLDRCACSCSECQGAFNLHVGSILIGSSRQGASCACSEAYAAARS